MDDEISKKFLNKKRIDYSLNLKFEKFILKEIGNSKNSLFVSHPTVADQWINIDFVFF